MMWGAGIGRRCRLRVVGTMGAAGMRIRVYRIMGRGCGGRGWD